MILIHFDILLNCVWIQSEIISINKGLGAPTNLKRPERLETRETPNNSYTLSLVFHLTDTLLAWYQICTILELYVNCGHIV